MGIISDDFWMAKALQWAAHAKTMNEVPIGAVLVVGSELIATGYNQPIGTHDPTAHAEIIALRNAANVLQNYRLPGATLYTTLEPCAMCAGAMVHARIQRLVYAAKDPKSGAAGSVCNLVQHAQFNHRLEVTAGVLEEPASQLLKVFFQERR